MRFMMIHYLDESILTSDQNGEETKDQEDARIREARDRELEAWDRELEAWDKEMKERGILVGGGVLDLPGKTTTLRVRDGKVLVTDGPFAETKEQIAGYSVLECADQAEAIEVASRHPTGRFGTFELRPYAD